MGSAAAALAKGTLSRAARSEGNSATIVQLSPQRGDGTDEITSWVAICGDGKAVALAAYYAVPGRIEEVVDFMPAPGARMVGEHAS